MAIAASSRSANASGPPRGEQIGGIGALRHLHDAQLESAVLGQPRRAQHRLLPGAVGVEREDHHAARPGPAPPAAPAVSAVPMIATVSRIPAWCSASTSV